MFRTRIALITATALGSLVGFAGSTAHAASSDITISHSVNCSNLQLTVTGTNAGTTPEQIEFTMDKPGSFTVTSTVTVLPNESQSHSFTLSPGDIIEAVSMRDSQGNTFASIALNLIVSSDDDCTRPAFDHVVLLNPVVSCDGDWMHITADIENQGDYAAEMAFWAHGMWPDVATENAAFAAGWSVFEQFPLAPGETKHIDGSFKVNDTYEYMVRNWTTNQQIFWAAPRPLGESDLACGGNNPLPESVDETPDAPADTVPATTVPATTVPATTVPATVPAPADSAAPTTVAGSANSSGVEPTLPSTGSSSWVLVAAAALLSSLGGLLIRTSRRAI